MPSKFLHHEWADTMFGKQILELLDQGQTVTVEGLRALVLHELMDLQAAINGGEFDTLDMFYANNQRIGEVPAALRVAERLRLRFEPRGITITPEHQLKKAKRCDFTASKVFQGKRRFLATEIKGQWNKDLYTSASCQLHKLYSIHPDAEQQGIYLVLWFGADEKIANKKNTTVTSAAQLCDLVVETVPMDLRGLVDVFVLDLSKP